MRLLDQVLYSPNFLEKNPSLATECCFYSIIYGPSEKYFEYIQSLKIALSKGGRSKGWNMRFHIDYAKRIMHPDCQWIEKLAQVINGEMSIKGLAGWERWVKCPLSLKANICPSLPDNVLFTASYRRSKKPYPQSTPSLPLPSIPPPSLSPLNPENNTRQSKRKSSHSNEDSLDLVPHTRLSNIFESKTSKKKFYHGRSAGL